MKVITKHKHIIKEALFFVFGGILGLVILGVFLLQESKDLILPGVSTGTIDLSFKTTDDARKILEQSTAEYHPIIMYNASEIEIPSDVVEWKIDQTVERTSRIRSELLRGKVDLPLDVALNRDKYASWSGEVSELVSIQPKYAEVAYLNGEYKVENGEDGVTLDSEALASKIVETSSRLKNTEIEVPIKHTRGRLSEGEITKAEESATTLSKKSLKLKIERENVLLSGKELVSFVSLNPGEAGGIDEETVATYLKGIAERYNRKPQNATLEFAEGKVKEFAPSRDGIEIKIEETGKKIQSGINELLGTEMKEVEIEAALTKTPPKVTTDTVNDLGINELIGRGESYYAHSIANRIYNVGLASTRVNGALVAPGEEFSFNGQVGEISSATGYKTAYVISGGRTILGDGGGVCQVSTTLFRAAMDSGFPITERWAHAYRVGYYEQNSDPGLDATIYAPSKDFKFLNDTPGHILIQTINDPKNTHLVFEIYGTDDGRQSSISETRVWGVTPPPPDLYQDDPSLPAGVVKQVDWSAWGAKTSFDYKVERDGETIFSKTYNSNYQPWQNVYLRGTAQ